MPRILGVDLPTDKQTHIALRYIYGIGPTLSLRICEQANVDPVRKAKELTDDEISRIAALLDREYTVEGPLRRHDQREYRPTQGRRLLSRAAPSPQPPVRGQRTKTNARTRKGPRKTVAGKKGVKEMR